MGIGLDTNIFILAYDKKTPKGDRARELLQKNKEANSKIFISVIVIEEFLVRIYKEELEKDILKYEDFITAGGFITVVDVNRQIARTAAKIRAEYPSLRTPDAIHLASAISAGVNTFITTDKRIPGKIGKLTVKVLA